MDLAGGDAAGRPAQRTGAGNPYNTAAPGPTGMSNATQIAVRAAPPRKNAMLSGSSSARSESRGGRELGRRRMVV